MKFGDWILALYGPPALALLLFGHRLHWSLSLLGLVDCIGLVLFQRWWRWGLDK